MKTASKELRKVYERTKGTCHLCHRKVFLKNYGRLGACGAWEINHSLAKANGVTQISGTSITIEGRLISDAA